MSEQDAVRERCNHLRHPACSRPELLATDPNQLWSWDITKLRGPEKLTYYYRQTCRPLDERPGCRQEPQPMPCRRLTPADIHYGRAAEKLAQRELILQQAYAAHPERFVQGQPLPASLPNAVWINQPASPTRLAEPDVSPILTTADTEDRATLESDPSAAVGERRSSENSAISTTARMPSTWRRHPQR